MTMNDTDVTLSAIYRAAEAKVREGQLGEAFADLPKPLLTFLVPTGMESLITKRTPAPRISIRKAVR